MIVYSTNPDFVFEQEKTPEPETPAPEKQRLIVTIDRSGRAGKQVTPVKGFKGRADDLADLGKTLKIKCGVGGTVKDGVITIQGDFRDKVTAMLNQMGYNAKRGNRWQTAPISYGLPKKPSRQDTCRCLRSLPQTSRPRTLGLSTPSTPSSWWLP